TEATISAPVVPATPQPARVSAPAPTDETFNVSASVGAPVLAEAPAPAAAPAMLIAAKVGELNGRPVRADEVINGVGSDVRATALARKFTLAQWTFVRGSEPDPSQADKEISRAQWLAYAQQKIGFELAQRLRDQLLAEEARASLKPEQKQGL